MSKKDEALKLALEALEGANAELEYLNDPKGFVSIRQEQIMDKARNALNALREALTSEAKGQPAQQEPVAWVPYLSDRADGVSGHYAIARWNPRGYREVWNLRRHAWGAYSDDVLSLEEADTLLRLIEIPTRKVETPQPAQEPVAWRTFDGEGGYEYRTYDMNESYADEWNKRNPKHRGWVEPLYTAPLPCPTCEALARTVMLDQTSHDIPPARKWVNLTVDELIDLEHKHLRHEALVQAIEAKLKEKNT